MGVTRVQKILTGCREAKGMAASTVQAVCDDQLAIGGLDQGILGWTVFQGRREDVSLRV